jgi:uncharacterized protein (DUF3820 family)
VQQKLNFMNDNSLMPFGEHKGKPLANVPEHYLIWLHTNNKCSGELKKYIEDNFNVKAKKKL